MSRSISLSVGSGGRDIYRLLIQVRDRADLLEDLHDLDRLGELLFIARRRLELDRLR